MAIAAARDKGRAQGRIFTKIARVTHRKFFRRAGLQEGDTNISGTLLVGKGFRPDATPIRRP
jgi:hypothetical protein